MISALWRHLRCYPIVPEW